MNAFEDNREQAGRGKGGRGSDLPACLWEEGVIENTKNTKYKESAKANTLWPSEASLGVSVHFPHSKHMSDHFP